MAIEKYRAAWHDGMDLAKVNSMTKYPSIPTYHKLGERGCLTEEVQVQFEGRVYLTEKVDGANCRLIGYNDGCYNDYLIGTREELVYAKGDRLWNPTQEIAPIVVPWVNQWLSDTGYNFEPYNVSIFYFECYGGPIRGSSEGRKVYGETGRLRLFDYWTTSYDEIGIRDMTPEQIANWRESGSQPFHHTKAIPRIGVRRYIPVVPHIAVVDAASLPTTVDGMYDFLQSHIGMTECSTDGATKGRAEGLVLRSADRKQIAKVRYEDYERTFRKRG